MINLLRLKNLEDQRSSEPIEVDGDAGKISESAGVFESIQVINQEIKQSMAYEMKRLGLNDDEIRYVFHIDKV